LGVGITLLGVGETSLGVAVTLLPSELLTEVALVSLNKRKCTLIFYELT